MGACGDEHPRPPQAARVVQVVDGDTVVVSSPQVQKAVAVRYAWDDNPACNVYNKQGLPAASFRTDDWPGVTADWGSSKATVSSAPAMVTAHGAAACA